MYEAYVYRGVCVNESWGVEIGQPFILEVVVHNGH